MRRAIQLCTPEFFAARRDWGCPAKDPIFIVGLPRSGSTLIEQILASHPLVEGTMELPDIMGIARDLGARPSRGQPPRYPEALAELSAPQCAELGDRYLAQPFILDNDTVVLKFGIGLSSLVNLVNFTSGTGTSQQTVQTPETTAINDQATVALKAARILFITVQLPRRSAARLIGTRGRSHVLLSSRATGILMPWLAGQTPRAGAARSAVLLETPT